MGSHAAVQGRATRPALSVLDADLASECAARLVDHWTRGPLSGDWRRANEFASAAYAYGLEPDQAYTAAKRTARLLQSRQLWQSAASPEAWPDAVASVHSGLLTDQRSGFGSWQRGMLLGRATVIHREGLSDMLAFMELRPRAVLYALVSLTWLRPDRRAESAQTFLADWLAHVEGKQPGSVAHRTAGDMLRAWRTSGLLVDHRPCVPKRVAASHALRLPPVALEGPFLDQSEFEARFRLPELWRFAKSYPARTRQLPATIAEPAQDSANGPRTGGITLKRATGL